MLYNLFRFLLVLILFVNNIMPESVVVLKKENQALKAQVESLSQAMQKLQEKFDQMQPIPLSGLVNADSSTIRKNTKSLEFLSFFFFFFFYYYFFFIFYFYFYYYFFF